MRYAGKPKKRTVQDGGSGPLGQMVFAHNKVRKTLPVFSSTDVTGDADVVGLCFQFLLFCEGRNQTGGCSGAGSISKCLLSLLMFGCNCLVTLLVFPLLEVWVPHAH